MYFISLIFFLYLSLDSTNGAIIYIDYKLGIGTCLYSKNSITIYYA